MTILSTFIYKQVVDKYGTKGNVSVPPPVVLKLKRYLNKSYRELESRLEQQHDHEPKKGEANRKHISTTDSDASVVCMGPGRSKLKYKVHRAIDEKYEIITATDVSAGSKISS